MTLVELVASVDRFVFDVAHRHRYHLGSAADFDDLVAAGRLAAVHAARRFNPKRGASFMTYAGRWIMQAVRRAAEHSHSVDIPERDHRRMQIERKKVPIMRLDRRRPGSKVAALDRLKVEWPREAVDERRAVEQLRALPREQQAVLHAFFWRDLALTEIALELGTYPERVARLRARGLATLRDQIRP